jgi:hypothetical protein
MSVIISMDIKKQIPDVGKIQRWSVTGMTSSSIKTSQIFQVLKL